MNPGLVVNIVLKENISLLKVFFQAKAPATQLSKFADTKVMLTSPRAFR